MSVSSVKDDGSTPGPEAFQSFAVLVTGVEDGQLNADITGELEDVLRSLNECIYQGTKGSATITVTVNLLANKGVIEVTGDYKVKMPKKSRGRSIFHIAGGRFLSRKDPRQPDLPLRSVDKTETATRTAS